MPMSHHSHSGEFCNHGENTLHEMVQAAFACKMEVFALTEHMPREQQDLYPEEVASVPTSEKLSEVFHGFFREATRLQSAHNMSMAILVGVEIDWIRPSSKDWVNSLLSKYQFDLFIGSVHHVHTVPIDYDTVNYIKARDIAGGTDERLFEDYFDLQLEMLQALEPPIVGHFDVIRLQSNSQNQDLRHWRGVWQRILRNLEFIAGYGGILELNSAALRKGLKEPYPKSEICKEFMKMNGGFTLSDDSHSINQIGTNYGGLLAFAKELGIPAITYFDKGSQTLDRRFPGVSTKTVSLTELQARAFFG
ncbi:MAG: hypothetical protein LQ342_005159 [Letrouitia transgressa]|nr:MAG: hypothetical protein LQ342_005159 [Letrouitia transgressa]